MEAEKNGVCLTFSQSPSTSIGVMDKIFSYTLRVLCITEVISAKDQ